MHLQAGAHGQQGRGDSRGAVLDCGADVFIDCRSEDFQAVVAQATQGRGVDVVIDFIGAPYLQRNVRSLADGGRLVSVGLLGGGRRVRSCPWTWCCTATC